MKLTELEPRFIRYETHVEPVSVVERDEDTWRARGCPTREEIRPVEYHVTADGFNDSQGILFLCPKCFAENGGPVGTHQVAVTFEGRGVTEEQGTHRQDFTPVRWSVSGTGYEDLTISPSILITAGCAWHGFVTDGEIR